VRIVEPDQAPARSIVERERVLEAVRAFGPRRYAPDLEPQTVAVIEPVHAPIEGEQELQGMILLSLIHIISSHDNDTRKNQSLWNLLTHARMGPLPAT
jgi:hypothetical protein